MIQAQIVVVWYAQSGVYGLMEHRWTALATGRPYCRVCLIRKPRSNSKAASEPCRPVTDNSRMAMAEALENNDGVLYVAPGNPDIAPALSWRAMQALVRSGHVTYRSCDLACQDERKRTYVYALTEKGEDHVATYDEIKLRRMSVAA